MHAGMQQRILRLRVRPPQRQRRKSRANAPLRMTKRYRGNSPLKDTAVPSHHHQNPSAAERQKRGAAFSPGRSPGYACIMCPSPAGAALATDPLSIHQLDYAVHRYTHPEIHNQSKVESVRMVTSCRRQMRHDRNKIQNISQNNGDSLFERSSQHVLTWTPEADDLMRGKRLSAIGCQLSAKESLSRWPTAES
jgi:hypothetical protein